MGMLTDHSYGIIPLRKEEGEWKVFLVHHKNGDFWGFPKGHAEKGETPKQAATRELEEETGLQIESFLEDGPYLEHYQFEKEGETIDKHVTFFPALVSQMSTLQESELHGGDWLAFGDCEQKLTYPEAKAILRSLDITG